MAIVKPFQCIRPRAELAGEVAALPYDVYNRQEAKEAVSGRPLSFLNIDRAETGMPEEIDPYDSRVYERAAKLLSEAVADGTYVTDQEESYYLYRLTMDGRSQTGFVACSSIDDYMQGLIRRHENTRADKELDRIRHVDTTNMHTGPVFLAYRQTQRLKEISEAVCRETPLFDFVSEDGIRHTGWRVGDPKQTEAIEQAFLEIPSTYIADGHHRAASAVAVGAKRREECPDCKGDEPFHYFLSVLFPDEELMILPYNRVVKDLNGLDLNGFLEKVSESFQVEPAGTQAVAPDRKGTFGMYLEGQWYRLTALECCKNTDPVKGLDVSILQDRLLGPVLGIGDPRTDRRIDFIGGIRGLAELERRCGLDMKVAFSMYPTSIGELLSVADAGLLMPPKSTWFEPKLRSGLFLHSLGERG